MISSIIGILLAILFLIVSLGNWVVVVSFFGKGKTGSMIPLLGALVGLGSLYFLMPNSLSKFWWVPCIVDAGCFVWFILTIGGLLGFFNKGNN